MAKSVADEIRANDALDKKVQDHWKYVYSVLKFSGKVDDSSLAEIEFHYKSAFLHGYKHAKEDS